MSIEAVLINLNTSTVEGVIAVNSFEDPVPEGYKLLPVPIEIFFRDQEEKELYNILKEIDPDFENPDLIKQTRIIHPWQTKWTEEKGFYEEL